MEDPIVVQSAVRLPTPPPPEAFAAQTAGKRKRSPPSRSPSPPRRRLPPRGPVRSAAGLPDVDPQRAAERERQLAERLRHREEGASSKPLTAEEKQAAAKSEYEKLLTMRSGGTYIPPARLRALQAQITDKTSKEYQRMSWEALKKSINGLINKINVSNIKHIVPELFGENLIRGRGLFCRSIMKAQAASLPFTPIYATMAAIVNTKLPQVGELLLKRLIVQFKKAFKRNDKAVCLSSTTFIAHLCNQQVAHEMLAAQILLLLLHKPTDDSVEIAVGLTREVGQHLEEMSKPIALAVFDQFRSILHEHDIDKRVQYMIEVLFQVRKDKYKDNPAIKEELDLVEEEDQITHQSALDDELEVQDGLNVFKFDAEWEEHEEAYKKLKAEILGEAEGSDEDDEDGSDDSSDNEEASGERALEIKDQSNTDLVNLRRTIYLTIMSSIDFEECCHKLMKVTLPPGQEPELPSMIVECCSQERTYSKFYGLTGERFAKLNRLWTELFESSFAKYFDTIHRYETNRLRNIARFFGHLLSSNAIGWHVLSIVHLNEEETTASSRIFIKILFQDLAEALGMPKLQARLKDDLLRPSYDGLFPMDNPRNTRFSINYFTSIGMGAITEEMREHLKNLPKPTVPALPAAEPDSDSASSHSSYSSYTGSSRSYSRSRSASRARGHGRGHSRSVSRTPPRRGARDRRYSSSPSPNPRRRNYSISPPARRSRSPYNTQPKRPVGRARGRSYSASSEDSYRARRNDDRRRRPRYSSRSLSRPRRNGPSVEGRRRSDTRSVSPPRDYHRRDSFSRSPPRRREGRGKSRSPSPLPYHRAQRNGRSPSPPTKYRRRNSSSSLSPPPRNLGRVDSSPEPLPTRVRRRGSSSLPGKHVLSNDRARNGRRSVSLVRRRSPSYEARPQARGGREEARKRQEDVGRSGRARAADYL